MTLFNAAKNIEDFVGIVGLSDISEVLNFKEDDWKIFRIKIEEVTAEEILNLSIVKGILDRIDNDSK